MNLVVNGEPAEVADGCTVTELVAQLMATPSGIAVAVDGEVRPRHVWDDTLQEGSRVEVLTAVQGG